MCKVNSSKFLLFVVFIALVSVQLGATRDAYGDVFGKTSMTVVNVRRVDPGLVHNIGSPIQWEELYGIYDYRVVGVDQYWKNDPQPIPFERNTLGSFAGVLWAVYDKDCASGGNKSFVLHSWEFVWAHDQYSFGGGGASACGGWQGMMISSVYKNENKAGQARSNVIFTQK